MTDNDKRLFASIYHDDEGRIHVALEGEAVKEMNGQQLMEALHGSIETLKQIKADVLAAAAMPDDAGLHFEYMASTKH